MAWNDLAPNQMVSFNDIQESGFGLKQGVSAISTNECITRDEALAMYYLNPYAVAPYDANQLIPKSSLVSSGFGITLCYDAGNSSTACNYCINPPPPPPPPVTGPLYLGTGFDGWIGAIQEQPDGNILVGGRYTTYCGVSFTSLMRLQANGAIDYGFTLDALTNLNGALPTVQNIILLDDGKIVIGGTFYKVGAVDSKGIAILNPNGTLSQASTVLQGGSDDVIRDQSGNFLIQGRYSTTGDVVKLNPDLTLNRSWITSPYQIVQAIELNEGSNRLYIGIKDEYSTTTYRIESYNYSTGDYVGVSQDFNRPVMNIKKLSDGRLIVVGEFTTINGQSTRQIVVLNSDLTVNTLFPNGFSYSSPNRDGVAATIFVQDDGKILIGGRASTTYEFSPVYAEFIPPFNSFNGVACSSIVRLNADFTRDTTFNMGTGFELVEAINPYQAKFAQVFAITSQTYGLGEGVSNILIGGYVTKYNGATIAHLVSTDITGSKNSL